MGRIADKHGLTNPYREGGSKRVVKRGRPRKYLFGAPSKRKKTFKIKTIKTAPKKKETIVPDYSYITKRENEAARKAEKETITCSICGSRNIEKTNTVYVCKNCRAISRLKPDIDLEIANSEKKWWQFWK